jgi:tetratricopeptide (TPR) repeat protein
MKGEKDSDSPVEILRLINELLDDNPEDFVLHYLKGIIYEKKGMDEKNQNFLEHAKDSFETVLKLNPFVMMAYYHLQKLYLTLGVKTKALDLTLKALGKYPKDFTAYLALSKLNTEPVLLENSLKEALSIHDDPQIHLLLSTVYTIQKKLDLAQEELKKASEDIENLRREYHGLRVLFYLRQSNFPKAEEVINEIRKQDPEVADGLQNFWGIFKYMLEGNLKEATKIIKDMLQSNPKLEEIYPLLLVNLLALNRFEEVKSFLKKWETSTANLLSYSGFLIFYYLMTNEVEELKKATQLQAKIIVNTNFGDSIQKAETEMESMLTQVYDKGLLLYQLGMISLAKGEVQKAKAYFEKSIKENPEENPSRIALACLHVADKKVKEAEMVLKDSKNETDLLHLSLIYLAQKNYKEAESILRQLVDSKTSKQTPYLLLWVMYHLQGKKEKAQEIFRSYLEHALLIISP